MSIYYVKLPQNVVIKKEILKMMEIFLIEPRENLITYKWEYWWKLLLYLTRTHSRFIECMEKTCKDVSSKLIKCEVFMPLQNNLKLTVR